MSWQPSATLPVLQQRAILYRTIRQFFYERQVLELDVPVLSEFATIDPFIDSLSTSVMGKPHYLQTSPEFFLKRFLAEHPCDVYSLGKAFRQGEKGRRHSPEFTMLEWYRVGWDEQQLMEEVRQLVAAIIPDLSWQALSYQALFQQYVGCDPHIENANSLRSIAKQHITTDFESEDKNPWLDLLFTHCIEPKLPHGLVTVYDYPQSQVALARLHRDKQGQVVAKRFEIYINGLELANGYWELCDGDEQEQRFQADQHYRQQHGLPELPYDQRLVSALKEGCLPNCAGVALGIDRLLMQQLHITDISNVLSFADR
jgi:lysyl-tRNA synthetase class 2